MSVELKPCPFCGGDEVTIGSFGSSCVEPQHYVSCEECDGATVNHVSEGEAIAAWNRRAASEPITDAAREFGDKEARRIYDEACLTVMQKKLPSLTFDAWCAAFIPALLAEIDRAGAKGGSENG